MNGGNVRSQEVLFRSWARRALSSSPEPFARFPPSPYYRFFKVLTAIKKPHLSVELGLCGGGGSYHLAIKSYTSRAISDGFDRQPTDGVPDIYGPGQMGSDFCDIVIVEVPTPTPTPTFTVTPTPTPTPTFTPSPTPPAFGPGVFQDLKQPVRGNVATSLTVSLADRPPRSIVAVMLDN